LTLLRNLQLRFILVVIAQITGDDFILNLLGQGPTYQAFGILQLGQIHFTLELKVFQAAKMQNEGSLQRISKSPTSCISNN